MNAIRISIGFSPTKGLVPVDRRDVRCDRIRDDGTSAWVANGVQGSGMIVLTTLTSTRAPGTFTFTAPVFGSAATPATRTVTSGTFDVTC